jgi:hypothetical protein
MNERDSARRAYFRAQQRYDRMLQLCIDTIEPLGIATNELTAARLRYEATLSTPTKSEQ